LSLSVAVAATDTFRVGNDDDGDAGKDDDSNSLILWNESRTGDGKGNVGSTRTVLNGAALFTCTFVFTLSCRLPYIIMMMMKEATQRLTIATNDRTNSNGNSNTKGKTNEIVHRRGGKMLYRNLASYFYALSVVGASYVRYVNYEKVYTLYVDLIHYIYLLTRTSAYEQVFFQRSLFDFDIFCTSHFKSTMSSPVKKSPLGKRKYGVDDSEGDFDKYEIAPNSLAKCRSCKTNIHQGLKRVGKLTKTDRYNKGYIHEYHHASCYGEEKLSELKLKADSPEDAIKQQVKVRMDLRLSLEGLRKQLARDKRCQDFKIFASKTLESLVSTMPASEDALLKINGIGPIKKEDFGKALLAIINHYHRKYSDPPEEELTWEEKATEDNPDLANEDFYKRGGWMYVLLTKK
jgi:hypothetical protein